MAGPELKYSLKEILEEEYRIYEQIAPLVRQKLDALTSNDVSRLKEIASALDPFAAALTGCEEKRSALISRIAEQEQIGLSEITLTRLAEAWHFPELLEVRDRLRAVMLEVRKVNQKSSLLLQQAGKVYNDLRDMLLSPLQGFAGYNAEGKMDQPDLGYFDREV